VVVIPIRSRPPPAAVRGASTGANGSPGRRPLSRGSAAAVSRTVRVRTNSSIQACATELTALISGPGETRPRVGLRATSPHSAAGMRRDPPPSLPWASGTRPAATAAADPLLDPPVAWSVFQGLRGIVCSARSETPSSTPCSADVLRPRKAKPASRSAAAR
jgi:hypothetical protein